MLGPAQLPRNLSAALRDTASTRPGVAEAALRDLGRIARGSPDARAEALAGIEKALLDEPRTGVRAEAALALADAGASESLERLLAATRDPELRVRQMALVAIGELADEENAPALIAVERALADPAPALRYQALIAIARLAPARRAEALSDALSDESDEIRYIALRLLEEDIVDRQQELAAATRARAEKLLLDDERAVRVAAAIVLARAGSDAGHALLVEAASDPGSLDAEDAQAAIELAGELRLDAAQRGLEREAFALLGWRNARFGWHALVALARMQHTRAIQAILRDLGAWTRDTRTLAVAAAGRARLRDAREPIRAMRGEPGRADPDAVEEALALIEAEG